MSSPDLPLRVSDLLAMLKGDGWERMKDAERKLDENETLWVLSNPTKPGRITILGREDDIVPPDVLERALIQARIEIPA